MSFSTPRVLAIAAVAAFLSYGTASAQQCATGQGTYYDVYPSTQEVTCGSRSLGITTAWFSGRQYAFQLEGCSFKAYPVYGAGVDSGVSGNPFGASNAYAHNAYRLRHVALYDDFPYGMVSMSSEGWAVFKIERNQQTGLITGFTSVSRFYFGDGNAPGTSQYVYGAKLFKAGTHVYVVGHFLNQTDFDLAIYDLGDGNSAPPMTFKTFVPSQPSTEWSSQFDVLYDNNGTPFLYVYNRNGANIYNVSNPASLVSLGSTGLEGLKFSQLASTSAGPTYPRGSSYARDAKRLYTYPQQGFFYIIDVTNPASPQQLVKQPVANGDPGYAGVSSDGKLLAVMTAKTDGVPMARYFSVAGDVPREITHTINWSSSGDAAFSLENAADILVVPPTAALPGSYKVLRAYSQRSYWDKVSLSCLDTTPTAGVSVTRQTNSGTATCSGNPTHGGELKGFPGDAFTITNGSTGLPTPTVASLVVTGIDATAGNTGYTSGDIKAQLVNNSLTWTSPNNLNGEFQVTLTLNETATPAIQYVYLCSDPDPALVVSQYKAPGGQFQACNSCGWLSGYTLKLSGTGSEGNPHWASSVWTVEYQAKGSQTWGAATSGDYTNYNDGTLDLTLNSLGTYRVTLDPEYTYTDTIPEKTAQLSLPSGAVTATIVVTQNSNNVADGGTVLTSQDITLSWSGQCSGGTQNCTFAWTAPVACTTATCTIPAGSLNTGQVVNLSLTVTHTSSGDTAQDTHTFTASNCSSPGSFSNTSPAAGATVQPGNVSFSWTTASGTAQINYTVKNTFGTTLCGPTGGNSCTASLTSGAVSWFVTAQNGCGSANSSTSSFTVSGGSGCTSPGTPGPISPAAGATVAPGSLTLSWSAVTGDAPITYTAKNTLGSTLCTTSSTSCSISVSSGTVSWYVQASNTCGTSSASASRSFTVSGGSCTTLGTASLTSPGNGATVNPGAVTLSWGAVSGTSPTYTVFYAGGLSQACAGTSATSCTINLSSGTVNWWVRAADACGSTTNSTTRSFTVGTPCTPPATPVLVSPADGATVNGSSVTLSWSTVSGDQPITYTAKTVPVPPFGTSTTLCTTTSTSCTYSPSTSGAVQWFVQASNACAPSGISSASRTFTANLCTATSAPVADFTVTPAQDSTITVGGVTQKQPYVGQTVTLTNTSAPGPLTDVSWYDFGVPGGVGTIKTTNASYAWPSAGGKNVRLTVANCYNGGSQSGEKLKVVTIYADTRPVVADFSPVDGTVGTPVTFTAATGAAYGDPDGFSWQFDDEGAPRTGVTTSRTFDCSKQVGLTLTVTGRGKTASTKKSVVIAGSPQCCSATVGPTATFAWTPSGTLSFQGVQQQQPYVGQLVQFTDPVPNNATSWRWEIALQPTPDSLTVIKTEHLPTYTFPAAGSYKVKMTPSNCFGAGTTVEKSVTVYADVRPVTADFSCTPASPAVGATVTCTAQTGFNYGDPDGFDWTFPGNVKRTGNPAQFAFTCAGANQVTLISKRGATASPSTSKTVTSTGTPSCCKPPNRAGSPSPASGATIPGGNVTLGWARPTQGTDPLRYDVYLDGVKLPECTDLTALQCLTTVLDGTITHVWKVIAKSDCGDTTTYPDTPPEWRFKACSATAVPDATSFTYAPSGPVEVKGVVQQQPFVGQHVVFSYNPSETAPATAWMWTDYQKSPAVFYDVPHPDIVYTSPGDKKMYLRASNCAGSRSITQYVHVYEDVRPVEARFSMSPASPDAFEPVTFTFDTSDEVGNPTQFTIDFGDGTPPETTTDASIQHAYGCAKQYRVSVTARRVKAGSTVVSEPHGEDLQVSGYPCSPQELLVVDQITQILGTDGVTERGDMIVFNPTADPMELEVTVRDRDTGVVTTGLRLPPLPPQGTLALADIMGQLNLNFSSATLWFKRTEEGATTLPVINAVRYIEATGGAKYGQFLPVFPVWPASDQNTSRWITGLIHNGSNAERNHTGFITKLTFVDPTLKDPNRTPWGSKRVILRLYDNQTGRLIDTDSLNLDDTRFNGYRQDYLNNFFHESSTLDMKAVTVQVEIPAGISVVVSSSMFDNVTARAVVFPSQSVQ